MFVPSSRGSFFVSGNRSFFLPYYSGPGPPDFGASQNPLQKESAFSRSHIYHDKSSSTNHLPFGIDAILGKDFAATPSSGTVNCFEQGSLEEAAIAMAMESANVQQSGHREKFPSNRCSYILVPSESCLFDYSPVFSRVHGEGGIHMPNQFRNSMVASGFGTDAEAGPSRLNDQEARTAGRRGMLRRTVFTDQQRKCLEESFQNSKYISKSDRRALAEKLSLKDNQVKVWFQNRRMKWQNSKEKKFSSKKDMITSDAESSLTTSSQEENYSYKQTSSDSSTPDNEWRATMNRKPNKTSFLLH